MRIQFSLQAENKTSKTAGVEYNTHKCILRFLLKRNFSFYSQPISTKDNHNKTNLFAD